MSWARLLKKFSDNRQDTDAVAENEAYRLFGAILDDGVEALEVGAVLALLQVTGVTQAQLLGFYRALAERRFRIAAPVAPTRPVILSSHTGTQVEPNLLPLLALVLQRLGVPVLVHGALNGAGRIATAHVLRELGVMPCASLAQAQAAIDHHKLAFVPTAVISPGLGQLLALKSRLGFDDVPRLLAKLLSPFESEALLVVAAGAESERNLLRGVLRAHDCNALLRDGTEGEAFANPRCRPEIEYVRGETVRLLFEAETGSRRTAGALLSAADAAGAARWIRRALDGEAPIPLPIVNQLACCLYAAGYTDDLNQAKAIVAVETGSLITA